MSLFGLFAIKKEMTRLWDKGIFVPVTLLLVPHQEVVRYKTADKDGYNSVVLGFDKVIRTHTNTRHKKTCVTYKNISEFVVDTDFMQKYPVGSVLDGVLLDGVASLNVVGYGKGKGFQGGMKRFHLKGGNKTRGSKFHRWIGSMGNRKPRRTQKGHPHAGHMGSERVTLKNVPILDSFVHDGTKIIAVRGSVPGAYNSVVKILVS